MPEKKQGSLHVDASTGERRIRLDGSAPKDDRPVVTLAQILLDEIPSIPTKEGEDKPEVRVHPLNMLGLAMLERRFGGIEKIPQAHPGDLKAKPPIPPQDICWSDKLAILTCLINQDRPATGQISEHEAGRLVNAANMELVDAAVEAATVPLAVFVQRKVQVIQAAVSAGRGSSTTPSNDSGSATPSGSDDSPSNG